MTAVRMEALTRALVAALQQVRHYGIQHPVAEESVRRLESVLRDELGRAPTVRWDASGEWLTVQRMLLPEGERHGPQLRQHLAARRVARLTITPQISSEGVVAFVRLLALEPEELIAAGGIAEALASAGVPGIEVEGPEAPPAPPPETDEYLDAIRDAAGLFAAIERGERLDVGRAQLTVERLDAGRRDTIALWAQVALRGHDELDPPHAVNVAFLAMELGRAIGLPREDQIHLGVAGFLHDVGMALLPWEERLLERTYAAQGPDLRHAVQGGLLLRHLGGRASVPMLAAMEHHQVFSGGAGLPPHTRLVALADYVDAMTCGRVRGLRPSTFGALLGALRAGEGPAFDPLHVQILTHLAGEAAASGVDMLAAG